MLQNATIPLYYFLQETPFLMKNYSWKLSFYKAKYVEIQLL